jgi:hypothetical protein
MAICFSNWQTFSFFLLGARGVGVVVRFSRQISKIKCLENIKFTRFYPMFEQVAKNIEKMLDLFLYFHIFLIAKSS